MSNNEKEINFFSDKKNNDFVFKFKQLFDGKLKLLNEDLKTFNDKKPERDPELHRFLSLAIIPSANVERKSLVEELYKLKETSELVARDVRNLVKSNKYFGFSESLRKSLLSSTRNVFCLYKVLVSLNEESFLRKLKFEKRLVFETKEAYNSLIKLLKNLEDHQKKTLALEKINSNIDKDCAINFKRFLKAQRVFSIEIQKLNKVAFESEITKLKCNENSSFNLNGESSSSFSEISSENLNFKLYGKKLEVLADRLHKYSNKIRKNSNNAKFDNEILNQLVTSSEEVLYLLKHENEIPVKSLEKRISVITEKTDMISEKLSLFDNSCKAKPNLSFEMNSSKKVSSKVHLAQAACNENIHPKNVNKTELQEKSTSRKVQQKLKHLKFLRRLHAKYHECSSTAFSESRTPLNPFSDTFSKNHDLSKQQKIEIRDMLKDYLTSENVIGVRNKNKFNKKKLKSSNLNKNEN